MIVLAAFAILFILVSVFLAAHVNVQIPGFPDNPSAGSLLAVIGHGIAAFIRSLF